MIYLVAMPDEKKIPFLETIYHLRTIEQIILYDRMLTIPENEVKEVGEFLRDEYERECLEYPFNPPEFDAHAAIWGAKTVYFAAQLLLNRTDTAKDLGMLLPYYGKEITPAAMLAADLCMRFLPVVVREMKNIDPDDLAIPRLQQNLNVFHYSNIGGEHVADEYDFTLFRDDCLRQLYQNRIVARKDKKLAQLPEIRPLLLADFGDYKSVYWKEMN